MTYSKFVINLKSRQDRLFKFLNQTNSVPNIEIFEAIKNTDYPNLGCAQSHKEIIEISKSRGDDYCFIFEDDATLKCCFSELEMTVCEMSQNRPNWEIFLLSASHAIDSDDYITLNYGREMINLREFCGTFAMVVSNRAYEKIIQSIENMSQMHHVDINIYSVSCKSNIYLLIPFMCHVLENDQSNIRKCDTTDDLERLKMEESRLILKTSFILSQ